MSLQTSWSTCLVRTSVPRMSSHECLQRPRSLQHVCIFRGDISVVRARVLVEDGFTQARGKATCGCRGG
eukprot:1918796-Pleurochrysis_carterae.AAC.1